MRARAVPAAPSRDWPVAALAAAGFALSVYLTATKLAGSGLLLCEAGGGCDAVQSSRYAMFLGVPTAAWGAILYAIVAWLALARLTARHWTALFCLAVVAAAFSGYLMYLQLFVLHAICPYCVADAVVAFTLLVVVLVRRPATTKGRRAVRPAQLAAIGVAIAAVTVVVAVGAYVADAPSASRGYQESLARHLTASGAVFYGAFW